MATVAAPSGGGGGGLPTGNALTDANANAPGSSGSAASAPPPANDCIWPGGTRDIGLGLHAPCLLSFGEARSFIGVLILLGGLGVVLFGAAALAVTEFAPAIGGAVEGAGLTAALFGAPEVGAPVAAAGGAVRQSGVRGAARARVQQQQRQQRALERNDERQYDAVMARKRDSAAGPAVRDREPVPF